MKRTVFLSLALFSFLLVGKTAHAKSGHLDNQLCSFDHIKEHLLSKVIGDTITYALWPCTRYWHQDTAGYNFIEFPFEAYAHHDGQTHHFSYATVATKDGKIAYLGLRYRDLSHRSYRENYGVGNWDVLFVDGDGEGISSTYLDKLKPSSCGSRSLIAYINKVATHDLESTDFDFDAADFGWERGCLDDTQSVARRSMGPNSLVGDSNSITALAPIVLFEEYDGVTYRLLIRRVELLERHARYFVEDAAGQSSGYDNMAFLAALVTPERGLRTVIGSTKNVRYKIRPAMYAVGRAREGNTEFGWTDNRPLMLSISFFSKNEDGENYLIDMKTQHPKMLPPAPFATLEEYNN